MSTHPTHEQRYEQLLADLFTEGLDETQLAELERLERELASAGKATASGTSMRDAMSYAAAAIDRAVFPVDQPMPTTLRDRVLAQAPNRATQPTVAAPAPPSESPVAPPPMRQGAASLSSPMQGTRLLFPLAVSGWLAAAAAIAVAVTAWTMQPGGGTSTGQTGVGPGGQAGTVDATPAERRAALLTSADDAFVTPWKPLDQPQYAQVQGDVVWSTSRQEGYMRLSGIPVNNPQQAEYQLWIVDPARDAEPIDGGVFSVSTEGEVIVPIHAKLNAPSPAAFAVTLEKPGGVVVSEGPLLFLAEAPKAPAGADQARS